MSEQSNPIHLHEGEPETYERNIDRARFVAESIDVFENAAVEKKSEATIDEQNNLKSISDKVAAEAAEIGLAAKRDMAGIPTSNVF